ncbi:MAG: signal peptidase I [Pseudomonadota bacterium]
MDKKMMERAALKTKPKEKDEDSFLEFGKAMAVAVLIALSIRSFAFEPFNIPSGSLLPTLQIGDYLFVEKYAYGYSRYSFPMELIDFRGRFFESEPKRGDIAVFRRPKKIDVDYIKRIVGLPGDRIQVAGGILHINGTPVMRDIRDSEVVEDDGRTTLYKRYIETLPNGVRHYIYEISDESRFDDTPVYTVPAGYYFAMGDNRDSSLDSRSTEEVGFIPAENLIGRAWFIFFSTEGVGHECNREGAFALATSFGCKLLKWPGAIRFSRIFKNVNKI